VATEKEELARQVELLKLRLDERGEELELLNNTNRRMLATLEDADGSMGGLTQGLQARRRCVLASHVLDATAASCARVVAAIVIVTIHLLCVLGGICRNLRRR
jgi:hypothetical protein